MKLLAENRRARFDYQILKTYEAGVSLLGYEVKSVKAGRLGLGGSYVLIRSGQAWLLNSQIPPYQPNNVPTEYDPARTRQLLLRRAELQELTGQLKIKGLALLPLKAYLKGNLIKLELGLGRSRKSHDKRELLKRRAAEREMRRFVP